MKIGQNQFCRPPSPGTQGIASVSARTEANLPSNRCRLIRITSLRVAFAAIGVARMSFVTANKIACRRAGDGFIHDVGGELHCDHLGITGGCRVNRHFVVGVVRNGQLRSSRKRCAGVVARRHCRKFRRRFHSEFDLRLCDSRLLSRIRGTNARLFLP